MSNGEFKTFSPKQRRSIAVPIISRGVKEGLTSTEIIRRIDKIGVTYRRQDMLNDIRVFRGRSDTLSVIRFLKPEESFLIKDIPLIKHKQPERFRYVVSWNRTNLKTGELETRVSSIFSDRLLEKQEVLSEAENLGKSVVGEEDYEFIIGTTSWLSISKSF